MRALKGCLRVAGIVCLLAVLGLVLPFSKFQALARMVTDEPLPDVPAFVYAMRVTSATYVAIGIFFLILARDPRRYAAMVPLAGWGAVFVGVTCGLSGLLMHMPAGWFLGDSLVCSLFGALVLVLWQRVRGRDSGADS
jgi:hypothetical protein